MSEEIKKRSWGYRGFLFLRSVFVFFFLLFYVMFGAHASYALVKMTLNKRQSIDTLPAFIEKSLDERNPTKVAEWVGFRPIAETEKLISVLSPYTGRLNPDIFFELSRRQVHRDHIEDALFWSQLARFRMRYDVLRCGVPDAEKKFDEIINLFSSPAISDLLQKRPEMVKKSIQQVMDFDAKYPAANRPDFICEIVDKLTDNDAPPVPEEQWEIIHRNLRFVTEEALKTMGEK